MDNVHKVQGELAVAIEAFLKDRGYALSKNPFDCVQIPIDGPAGAGTLEVPVTELLGRWD